MPDTLPLRPAPGPTSSDPPAAAKDMRDPAGERPASPTASLPPLLIDMAGLSQLLARSEASLYRDDSAGRIPAGLKVCGSKRWRYSEIVAWVEAGCPPRREWEARKNANGRPR